MSFDQKELDGLLASAAFHLEEFSTYMQAAYHCMCDRGEGNSVSLSLEMSSLIGKVKEKFKEIESYRSLDE